MTEWDRAGEAKLARIEWKVQMKNEEVFLVYVYRYHFNVER